MKGFAVRQIGWEVLESLSRGGLVLAPGLGDRALVSLLEGLAHEAPVARTLIGVAGPHGVGSSINDGPAVQVHRLVLGLSVLRPAPDVQWGANNVDD